VNQMTELTVKYWKEGKHILIEADNWDCFLRNESINPMINWLNLNRENFGLGLSCKGNDKITGVEYISVNGNLMIRTDRDVVFLSKSQREELMQWLHDHKDVLSIREVLL
jgi:hypothetical protein